MSNLVNGLFELITYYAMYHGGSHMISREESFQRYQMEEPSITPIARRKTPKA